MEDKFLELVERAEELGANAAKLITTDQIHFDARSRLKCRFGCNRWGRFWTCPPNTNVSQEQFMEAFELYTHGLVIQCAEPKKSQEITLALEKEAVFNCGSTFAFALALCVACEECAFPEPCLHPELARPTMDGYHMDIGRTVEPLGFEVKFDVGGQLLPAWYSMVLL